MKAIRLAILALARDGKSGELRVLMLALLVAVSALTAVGFFTNRVSRAVDQQAGEVLAADLRLRSNNPITRDYFTLAEEEGLQTAELATFPSVVFVGEESSLTAIRAVTDKYPLRGQLRVADVPFEKGTPTDEIPGKGEVWLEPRVMAQLNAEVGDRVRVGSMEMTIAKVLDYRPDQGSTFVDLAPTLLMRMDDLPATALVRTGSRISYAALFAGEDPAAVARVKAQLEARKTPSERISDLADASPQIRSAIDRAGRFLSLSALVTILLAAIAVAIAARRYVARHLDTVALMKSMGAPQRLVLQISVLELLMIAIAAGIIGSLIGYAAQAGIAMLLRELVRGDLPPPSLTAGGLGLMTSILMLIGFALPPLLQLRHVPPARVLRRNLEPPPLKYITVYGTALGSLIALLWWLLRDVELLIYVVLATAGTFAVLFGAGWLLVRGLGRLRGSVGISWRYGMANIARRGRDSVIQIIAFGLGLMVLLLLAVVRNDLMEEWRASLPTDAPNYFMINIRADQVEPIQTFFNEQQVAPPELVPMIRARLVEINGVSVNEMRLPTDRGREFVERESNLTWSQDPQDNNTIVAGEWWREGDEGGPRVSVEIELAQALGLKIGDQLTYDVAGEIVAAKVANFREVRWDTFLPNFFMVFSPGVLDNAAGTYITAVHIPQDRRAMMIEFTRNFSEVTAIDLEAIISQVRGVMDKATLAVQYVFGFTLLAGITVLLAAIQATRDERRYESAMLRTLGASRRVVFQGVAAEFATLGLLSGTLAAVGASAAGYFLAKQLFDLDYTFDPLVWVVGLVSGTLLVGVSGTLATRSVVNHPPIATLRGG